jgi:hypothetical protein
MPIWNAGTVPCRRRCLSQLILFSERSLQHALSEYVAHLKRALLSLGKLELLAASIIATPLVRQTIGFRTFEISPPLHGRSWCCYFRSRKAFRKVGGVGVIAA